MSNPGEIIGAAMAAIQHDDDEREQREKYRRSVRVLRAIPSGTPDTELTPEQRQAWQDHDDALAWFRAARGHE